MDTADAIHLKSWIDEAKAEAAREEEKLWLVRDGGGFKTQRNRPTNPVAEIFPGGRVVLWER